MIVKDMIEQLRQLNPESEVVLTSNNFELNGALVPLANIQQYEHSSKEKRRFRDAFDGTEYEEEVYSTRGGSLPVVFLT